MYKMLLVDDDYITREGLRDLIDWQAMGVVIAGEAEDGREALELARSLKPDIMISDVVMPGYDGIELIQSLREEQPELMTVMISAHHDIQYVKAAMKLEALDYLLKPFSQEELKQVVGRVTSKLRKRREELIKHADVDRYYSDSLSAEGLQIVGKLAERVEELCASGQSDELLASIERLFARIRSLQMDSMLFLTTIGSKLIVKAADKVDDDLEPAILTRLKLTLSQFQTMRSSEEIESLVTHQLMLLEEAWNEHEGEGGRKAIRLVKQHIHQDHGHDLTINRLAAKVFLSPSHLQALFKKETGQTINEFITSVRIEHAKQLLRDPAIKIYEVAGLVGYQDTYYFSKVFRKQIGMNPSEYKEIGR